MENWQAKRDAALESCGCVVVKVGSAVLSDGDRLNMGVLEQLVEQLVALQRGEGLGNGHPRRVVLVSSGAVAAGRVALSAQQTYARRSAATDLAARQATASIGQSRLMHLYDQAFSQHGVIMSQVLLTRDDLSCRSRFLNIRNTFSALLDWAVIPVVNENDTVSVNELKFSDNDNLASLLLNTVEADLFVNLTTIGGVLSANPQTCPDAGIMPVIEQVRELDLAELCGGKTTLGTGGMYSKLLSASRAAQLGVPTLILPGRTANIIPRAFSGETIGTWVCPEEHPVSRRKYWLAYQSDPQGVVEVDAGAAEAVQAHGKSLLPGGVAQVNGDFDAGALVSIAHNGHTIAAGLSNYAANDLRDIMGLSRLQIAAKLGDAHYPEVVHRDNMLVNSIC